MPLSAVTMLTRKLVPVVHAAQPVAAVTYEAVVGHHHLVPAALRADSLIVIGVAARLKKPEPVTPPAPVGSFATNAKPVAGSNVNAAFWLPMAGKRLPGAFGPLIAVRVGSVRSTPNVLVDAAVALPSASVAISETVYAAGPLVSANVEVLVIATPPTVAVYTIPPAPASVAAVRMTPFKLVPLSTTA